VYVLIGLIGFSLIVGGVLKRWIALAVPAVLIPLYYIGLRLGWWGFGVGDGWWMVGAVITLGATAGVGVTIAVARSWWTQTD